MHEWAAFMTFVPDPLGPHRLAVSCYDPRAWLKWLDETLVAGVPLEMDAVLEKRKPLEEFYCHLIVGLAFLILKGRRDVQRRVLNYMRERNMSFQLYEYEALATLQAVDRDTELSSRRSKKQ